MDIRNIIKNWYEKPNVKKEIIIDEKIIAIEKSKFIFFKINEDKIKKRSNTIFS